MFWLRFTKGGGVYTMMCEKSLISKERVQIRSSLPGSGAKNWLAQNSQPKLTKYMVNKVKLSRPMLPGNKGYHQVVCPDEVWIVFKRVCDRVNLDGKGFVIDYTTDLYNEIA